MASAFKTYNTIFENVSAHSGALLSFLPLFFLVITAGFGLLYRSRKEASSRLVYLSLVGIVVYSSLFFPVLYSWANIATIRLIGVLLIVLYPPLFGLQDSSNNSPIKHRNKLALVIILVSFVVKSMHIESWPAVLTDYGARTGREALEFLQNPNLYRLFSSKSRWVSAGGSSIIHTPLLLANFKIFGPGTIAIRFTEVLFSTATLGLLWLILKRTTHSFVALTGVTLCAFSAEHLSYSRIGTFYSASQALGLLILYLWLKLYDNKSYSRPLLLLAGICTLLAPFAYAPSKPVIIFSLFAALWLYRPLYSPAIKFWNNKARLGVFFLAILGIAFVINQYVISQPPFTYPAGTIHQLASDTPIWFKLDSTRVAPTPQSLFTSIKNVWENITILFNQGLREEGSFGFHKLFSLCNLALLPLSLMGIFFKKTRVISVYIFLAFAPQIIVAPLPRRSILMRPFIGVTLALFVFEYVSCFRKVIYPRYKKILIEAPLFLSLAIVPLQGVYSFTKLNGPVGVGPSFGPEYVQDMLIHLKKLDPKIPLVILNSYWASDKYRIALADRIFTSPRKSAPVYFRNLPRKWSKANIPHANGPVYIGILNEDYRRQLIPLLKERVPLITLHAYGEKNRIYYWIGSINAPSPD